MSADGARAALVESLQAELLCDDLEPPAEARGWSAIRLRAWFEAGGVEETDAELAAWLDAGGGPVSAESLRELGIATLAQALAAIHPERTPAVLAAHVSLALADDASVVWRGPLALLQPAHAPKAARLRPSSWPTLSSTA